MKTILIALLFCLTLTAAKPPDVRMATTDLELRACAGQDCQVLTIIPEDDQMTGDRVLGVADGIVWRRVIYNGVVGWVDNRQLKRYYPPVQWGRYA